MTVRLESSSMDRRPALVGLAFLSTLVGAFAVVRAAQNVWAVDAHRNLAAAAALQNGTFGSVPDYLYSPLAAAFTVPALALPTDVAVVAWLVLKIALLAVGTAVATRALFSVDRLLLLIAVIGFLPVLYDLELGNVTVIVLVAVAAIAWTPDRVATGIPLGLILATAPKPQLIPVLVWLVLAHRRALVGAVVMAALATMVGVALTGPAAYEAWVDALRAPAYLNSGEIINLAIWSLPPFVAVPGGVVAVVGFFIALRRGYWPGLVAAICLGLLLAPYTLIYAAALLPVGAPAMVRASPRAALGLAITAPVALVLAFPAWVGLVLAMTVLVPAAAWPPRFDSVATGSVDRAALVD
jgi:Glycosyltransferase family 87